MSQAKLVNNEEDVISGRPKRNVGNASAGEVSKVSKALIDQRAGAVARACMGVCKKPIEHRRTSRKSQEGDKGFDDRVRNYVAQK